MLLLNIAPTLTTRSMSEIALVTTVIGASECGTQLLRPQRRHCSQFQKYLAQI